MSAGPARENVWHENHIEIGSMFGLMSKRGIVRVRITTNVEGKVAQASLNMSPKEARDQARYLLEAAGAAERDEALYKTCEAMGMGESDAARFLMACREAYDGIEKNDDFKPEQDFY